MKKILFFLILLILMTISGCGNSIDIPQIEGEYSNINKSENNGELLSKQNIIIKKIAKNSYSISIKQYNSNPAKGNVDVYQEVEILEVKKDREKLPQSYKMSVKELSIGKGYYEKWERIELDGVNIYNINFYPKSATDPKDLINIKTNLKGNPSYMIGFSAYKDN